MKAREILRILKKRGCTVRQGKGSHVFVTSPCGKCRTPVAVHKGDDIPTGTLAKIRKLMAPCLGESWLTDTN